MTKGGKCRTTLLKGELNVVIDGQWTTRRLECPYVLHRAGKRIKDFWGSWEKAFNVVVMEGKIFHDFGRIAICHVLGDGLRMATLMTDDNTRYRFDRYDIVNGEDPQNACERMVMGRQQRMVTATLAIPSDTALL